MIIYKVTNEINNKVYIGQTINGLNKRKVQHLSKARRGIVTHFYNAIRKYGEEKFKWFIIEKCKNIKELNEREIYYINEFDSLNNGYNLKHGGDNKTYSDKSKQKMSKSANKRWENLNERKKVSEQRSGKNNIWYGTKGYWYGKKMDCITGDLNPAKRIEVRKK